MAGDLQAAGHRLVTVQDRSEQPRKQLDRGTVVCSWASEVASQSEIVILMLPDTPDVDRVLFSRGGVSDGIGAGKLVIDMSLIAPIATRVFAEKIRKRGSDYLDAPVSGGEVGAKTAALTIMCDREAEAFEHALAPFELMDKNITHVGSVGDGQVAQVANQIIAALNIEAVSEALVFAEKTGAAPAKVREALLGGFASSSVLEVHAERMIKRTFVPGFRIELHQKDLNLALGSARALGLAFPNTASTQQLFSACITQGGGGWNHSALVRAIKTLGACNVG